MTSRGFNSDDRVEQVNWIRQEAQDIINYDMDGSATAEELVTFWFQQPDVQKPEWFDNYDRNLLVRFISEAQN